MSQSHTTPCRLSAEALRAPTARRRWLACTEQEMNRMAAQLSSSRGWFVGPLGLHPEGRSGASTAVASALLHAEFVTEGWPRSHAKKKLYKYPHACRIPAPGSMCRCPSALNSYSKGRGMFAWGAFMRSRRGVAGRQKSSRSSSAKAALAVCPRIRSRI